MRIVRAEKTGFCFGVKRAVRMAELALGKNKPIHSLGSIIHNEQVVRGLALKGLKVIRNIDEVQEGTVVISSHGISPKVAQEMLKRGLKIIDTTCPFVLNAQKIAKSLSDEGYAVVIVGDSSHPEVKALVDFAPKKVMVVKSRVEALKLKLKPGEKVSVIAQTTQSMDNFLGVVHAVLEHSPRELRVFNTICKDAGSRQDKARAVAKKVDIMLVVGGANSANTKRLSEVCRKILKRSYLVETEEDLQAKWFKGCKTVGITSGASTPDWVIKKVVNKIKNLKKGVV